MRLCPKKKKDGWWDKNEHIETRLPVSISKINSVSKKR